MFEAERSCQHNVFHSCNKTSDYFVVAAETCLWQLKIQLTNSLLLFKRIPCPSVQHNQHPFAGALQNNMHYEKDKKFSVSYSCIFIMKCSMGCGLGQMEKSPFKPAGTDDNWWSF